MKLRFLAIITTTLFIWSCQKSRVDPTSNPASTVDVQKQASVPDSVTAIMAKYGLKLYKGPINPVASKNPMTWQHFIQMMEAEHRGLSGKGNKITNSAKSPASGGSGIDQGDLTSYQYDQNGFPSLLTFHFPNFAALGKPSELTIFSSFPGDYNGTITNSSLYPQIYQDGESWSYMHNSGWWTDGNFTLHSFEVRTVYVIGLPAYYENYTVTVTGNAGMAYITMFQTS